MSFFKNILQFTNVAKNMVTDASHIANNTNNIANSMNKYDAIHSLDESKKRIANNRVYCYNKFQWVKLTQVFYSALLPIILLFIILYLEKYYTGLISFIRYLFIWIIIGIVYLGYLNAFKWNII